jgi:hypothetical protein
MANDLLNLLQSQMNDDSFMQNLSQQIGGADTQQTKMAASGIMTTLLGALAKNASTPEGAQSLNNALEKDHDGSILDDVMGMLSGNAQPQNQRMLNGAGILNHLLGGKQNNAVNMISQVSGLDQNKTGNLMQMLAPVIMGALGKTKRQNGLDIGDLAGLLSGSFSQQKQQTSISSGLINSLLDQDGDGSVTDDIANIGFKMLGNLFKRRK